MICKNCSKEFEGNYCNHCGQVATISRINWKYLSNSIADNVFQINHGFLYTIKTLLLNPGKSLESFFDGKRKGFYKPFSFLLITSAIYLFLTKIIGNETFIDDFFKGFNDANNEVFKSNDNSIFDILRNNQTFIYLLIVPLYSIASSLAFKKFKYNFSEHLILNLYVMGQQLLIYSLFSFIKDREGMLILLPSILGFSYNLYVYNTLFKTKNWLIINLNMVLTYLIFVALLILSLFILSIIMVITVL